MTVDNEKAIRAIVKSSVKTFAGAFAEKHLSQLNNDDGGNGYPNCQVLPQDMLK